MLGLKNSVIREMIDRLQDPENWNGTPNYVHGKSCIVIASFSAAAKLSTHRYCDNRPALRVIRSVIGNRFGESRGTYHNPGADIISFNDHPMTTHADVMWVLRKAERITRPFWRKPPHPPETPNERNPRSGAYLYGGTVRWKSE